MDTEGQASDFATWLRGWAEQRGYAMGAPGRRTGGRSQLAKDAGLPQSVVSRLLSGEVLPSAETALRLAQVLNIGAVETLQRGGHKDLAGYIQDVAGPNLPPQGTPLLDVIEQSGLDEETRQHIATAYRRDLAHLEARIREMVAAAVSARNQALEDQIRLARQLVDGLSPDERQQLEQELLSQVQQAYEHVKLHAEELRREGAGGHEA